MSQRIIEVVPYDENWVKLFATEKQLLQQSLGANLLLVEHIGSTAVPGLAAKPIIDILLEVVSVAALDGQLAAMQALGYQAKGEHGIAGRRYYQKGQSSRSHHVHAFQSGDEHLLRHRAFKAYLLAHPSLAAEYAQLKQQAARQCQHNSELYMACKQDFVLWHQQQALLWYHS